MEGQQLITTNQVSGNDDALWLVHDGRQQWGPYTTEQLVQMLYAKQVDWLWNVWREGMNKWRPFANLFTIPELASDGQIRLRNFNDPVKPKAPRKRK